MGDEVEGLAIEVRGEGVIAHPGVDHPRSLEAIDDVGKLGEKSVAGRERLVEAARVEEIQHGVRELRGLATLRLGDVWMPVLQLSLGVGARFRSRAVMFVPTEQGSFWLPPDDQGAAVSLDLVTGLRAGFERRITLHWTAGLTAATAQSFGIGTPDLRTTEVAFSLSYSRWAP